MNQINKYIMLYMLRIGDFFINSKILLFMHNIISFFMFFFYRLFYGIVFRQITFNNNSFDRNCFNNKSFDNKSFDNKSFDNKSKNKSNNKEEHALFESEENKTILKIQKLRKCKGMFKNINMVFICDGNRRWAKKHGYTDTNKKVKIIDSHLGDGCHG